jgi:hypothetical protein
LEFEVLLDGKPLKGTAFTEKARYPEASVNDLQSKAVQNALIKAVYFKFGPNSASGE